MKLPSDSQNNTSVSSQISRVGYFRRQCSSCELEVCPFKFLLKSFKKSLPKQIMKSLIGQTKIDELETLMCVQSNNFIRNKIETYWVHNHEITVKEHARARDQEPSPKDQVNCSIPRSLLLLV